MTPSLRQHSEALRRVVRAGSRGTIGPQRGKLNQVILVSPRSGCDYTEDDATDLQKMMRRRVRTDS